MTKNELLKIITYLREAFPNGSEITENTVNVWFDLLGEYDYRLAWECMRQVARNWDGYTMPPPSAIIKRINSASAGNSDIEIWNEADKLISRGTVLTREEFEAASPIIQSYFGSVNRIRELALMDAGQTANERARFLRQVPKIREKVETRSALPADVLAMIDGVAERKQLQ